MTADRMSSSAQIYAVREWRTISAWEHTGFEEQLNIRSRDGWEVFAAGRGRVGDNSSYWWAVLWRWTSHESQEAPR